jgi:serine/threonine-protein kinase HipA
MTEVKILEIRLYDEPIGSLTDLGNDRNIFSFTDDYIANSDRPTLSLGFKDNMGDLVTDFVPHQKRLMPFFSNMLPEGSMREYLAERAGVNSEREFPLLAVLGRDLPGAVTAIPIDGHPQLIGLDQFESDKASEEEAPDNALHFSLAGVQLKFSAVMDASGGLTVPASGAGGSWIVKLPSAEFPAVPENEFSMMKLASLIGMDVPRIELVDVASIANVPGGIEKAGPKAFVIERFDRLADGGRVHIEDFAQVMDVYPEKKYKKASMRTILRVIGNEGTWQDVVEFVRRLTFNMLIGNGDMHLKNWSLIYLDRVTPSLAPAYDFVSTIPYLPGDNTGLNISRSKSFSDFNVDEVSHMAAKASVPIRTVLDTVEETVELFFQHWQAESANLPMTDLVRDAIDAHLGKLPIVEEMAARKSAHSRQINGRTAPRSGFVRAALESATHSPASGFVMPTREGHDQ